jgi:hypothetical protein
VSSVAVVAVLSLVVDEADPVQALTTNARSVTHVTNARLFFMFSFQIPIHQPLGHLPRIYIAWRGDLQLFSWLKFNLTQISRVQKR